MAALRVNRTNFGRACWTDVHYYFYVDYYYVGGWTMVRAILLTMLAISKVGCVVYYLQRFRPNDMATPKFWFVG